MLGDVVDGKMRLWMEGQMVAEAWDGLDNRFRGVSTDAFVVMPNHVHGIVVIEAETGPRSANQMVFEGAGAMNRAPTAEAAPVDGGVHWTPALGEIVRVFKAVSARRIRDVGDPDFGWQRNYYERVIRNEREWERARAYVAANPARWVEDAENPRVRG